MIGFPPRFLIALGDFSLNKFLVFLFVFSSCLGDFLPIDIHNFFLSFLPSLESIFQSAKLWSQILHAHRSLPPREKAIVISWIHMISHVMERNWLGQFRIITHLEVNLSLIIYHLTYLIFSVNLLNQSFELTYAINLFNQFTLNWQHHWLVERCFLKHTYVRGCTPTYWLMYDLGS